MSYARFSEYSDVYVISTIQNSTGKQIFECCACLLLEDEDGPGGFIAYSVEEMINHLYKHIRNGHLVPAECFDKLNQETEK